MKQKNTNRNVFLFVLLAIAFYVGVNFVSPPALDIGRYYESIEDIYRGLTASQTILLRVAERGDFLYILALWFFDQTFLGMTFVTGCVLVLYYFFVLWPFVKYVNRLTTTSLLLMLGLFCFPEFIWVITISRTTMMLVLFFVGVLLWLKHKRTYSLMFFALSCLTHVSALMFIVIFVGGVWLYDKWFSKRGYAVNILCAILPLLLCIVIRVLLQSFMNLSLLSSVTEGTGYSSYVGGQLSTIQYDNYGYGSKAMMLTNMVSMYLLINVDRRRSLYRFLLMIFGACTFGFMFASQTFYNRFSMCLPLFFALYMSELYTNRVKDPSTKQQEKRVLNTMAINAALCVVSFMLEIYSYRFWTLI